MMASSPPLPVEFLAPRERARIVALDGELLEVQRLQEMGLSVGAELQMVQPGNPCILRISEQRISFRPEGTAAVLVESLTPSLPTG